MFYTTHGRFTDPGAASSWIDGVPAELPAVRDAAARLVFHSWAYGDVTELGFAADRRSETELRYADAVLDRARELNPALPAADRPLDSATPPDEAVIDRRAAVLDDPEVTVERIQAEFADPALKVPDTIAGYPPPDHQRRQIILR